MLLLIDAVINFSGSQGIILDSAKRQTEFAANYMSFNAQMPIRWKHVE